MRELGLLKLIADFDCISREEIHMLAKALRERYDLRGLEEVSEIDRALELLESIGLLEVSRLKCVKLTQKGLELVRSRLAGINASV